MSSLLDLVVNFVRINHLTHAPVAVLKYANLQAPLLLTKPAARAEALDDGPSDRVL
jgi:hypothetical protein